MNGLERIFCSAMRRQDPDVMSTKITHRYTLIEYPTEVHKYATPPDVQALLKRFRATGELPDGPFAVTLLPVS